ncbi:type IV pilus modification PilV family protein [Sediminibacillus massiliensis]|uniref:type IV pilus modification PilV family protein n=1 Tax=Sediminibacillus massiliensis TaxID=1926277 RepID=UPI0015C2FBD6|nr:type II secretion system protein [Sediminibacillus massiliensis]
MLSNRYENINGFTLIEILAAISLLGIVSIAFIPFFSNFAIFTNKAEDKLTAVNIADQTAYEIERDEQLEQILSTRAATAVCPATDSVSLEETGITTQYTVNGKQYFPRLSICQSPEEKEADLYRAKVEIYRSNQDQPADSYLYTYLKVSGSEEID